jgi:uncharacterized membrane protein (DUF2068 family)
VLEVISALFILLGAAAFGFIGAIGIGSFMGAISGFGSVLLILIGIILLIGAYGMWDGDKWGYWFNVIIACLGILSIAILDVVGFVAGIIVLYYLTRKRVKKWFTVD